MSEKLQDELPGSGGSYVRSPDGVLTLVEEPTKDHPEGNQARDRHGKPIAAPIEPKKSSAPAAAAEKPAEKKGGAK